MKPVSYLICIKIQTTALDYFLTLRKYSFQSYIEMCDVSVVEDTDASVEQWSLGNIPVEVCVILNLSQFSVKTILILSNLFIICFHLCTFNPTANVGYFYCCVMSVAAGYKIIFIMRGYHVLCLCYMSCQPHPPCCVYPESIRWAVQCSI